MEFPLVSNSPLVQFHRAMVIFIPIRQAIKKVRRLDKLNEKPVVK